MNLSLHTKICFQERIAIIGTINIILKIVIIRTLGCVNIISTSFSTTSLQDIECFHVLFVDQIRN